jgi:hypothetical protein
MQSFLEAGDPKVELEDFLHRGVQSSQFLGSPDAPLVGIRHRPIISSTAPEDNAGSNVPKFNICPD